MIYKLFEEKMETIIVCCVLCVFIYVSISHTDLYTGDGLHCSYKSYLVFTKKSQIVQKVLGNYSNEHKNPEIIWYIIAYAFKLFSLTLEIKSHKIIVKIDIMNIMTAIIYIFF